MTGRDRWHGPTVQNLSVGGRTIVPKALGNFIMLMATFTKANGSTIKQTATESLCMLMELTMRERGRTISNMVKVKRHGLMARSI